MKKHKILYGISGIGNGHTNRQAPIIEHFTKISDMVIFAYQESYKHYQEKFSNNPSVTVVPIDVPFWVGNATGLDFSATAQRNAGKDFITINCTAMARAEEILGKPDLVITDYEPVSAQYAYAMNAPLVTLDQQSKYLIGDFPPLLNGQAYQDEIVRLSMFFPKASARIACSFFTVPPKKEHTLDVQIFPSTLKDSITSLKRNPSKEQLSLLLYISSQRAFVQTHEEILRICQSLPKVQFHIFATGISLEDSSNIPDNVLLYEHGDPRFLNILATCNGIVTTAGHMLLSEAMYLGIPLYTIPLAVYEQHMNAFVIKKGNFGIMHHTIEREKLLFFIEHLEEFTQNIERDELYLLIRQAGQDKIISYLTTTFLS